MENSSSELNNVTIISEAFERSGGSLFVGYTDSAGARWLLNLTPERYYSEYIKRLEKFMNSRPPGDEIKQTLVSAFSEILTSTQIAGGMGKKTPQDLAAGWLSGAERALSAAAASPEKNTDSFHFIRKDGQKNYVVDVRARYFTPEDRSVLVFPSADKLMEAVANQKLLGGDFSFRPFRLTFNDADWASCLSKLPLKQ